MIFNQECPPRFPSNHQEGTVMSVIIGIDPHKGLHAACAIDEHETELAHLEVRTSTRQVTDLLAWAASFDCRSWAIESAGGLG